MDVLGQKLTDVEAAVVCGVKVATLRKWRLLGKGPRYLKVGQRSIRYLLSDLETFLVRSTSDNENLRK
jgi:hypothetical protein